MTKIVYIDSENSIRESYAHLLEAVGYQVLQATTAQYGMWLCREFKPDLIITTRDPVDAEQEDPEFVDSLRGIVDRTPIVVVTHGPGGERNASAVAERQSEPHNYLELMNAIRKALDDGVSEARLTPAETAKAQ
jgi:DNA-binding NtrC family response regulator